MKQFFIAILCSMFALSACAAEPAKKEEKKEEQVVNCVKKDKKGNCPPPPKGVKPTPKKKAEPTK